MTGDVTIACDRFIVLSGCSGAGKSTLMEELARRGHGTVPEAGRAIIGEQKATGGDAIPGRDDLKFVELTVAHIVRAMAAAAERPGRTFFDRSIVDKVSHFEHIDVAVPHYLRAGAPFDAVRFRQFLREVASRGLRILVTELDVSDRDLPDEHAQRDRAVADLTRRFLDAALDERALKTVLTWGLSDRYSWLHDSQWIRRADGQRQRGLPLDEELSRKPMWQAIAAAFDAAAPR